MRIFIVGFFLFLVQIGNAQVIDEENTDILLQNGISEYQKGNFDSALEFANKGLSLAPDYHDIRILRIRIFHAKEAFKKAEEDLLYLLKNAADYNEVKELGIRQLRLMGPEEGEKFFEKLSETYPNDIEIDLVQAELLFSRGNLQLAREVSLDILTREGLSGKHRLQLNNILRATVKNEVGLTYQVFSFDENYNRDNWQNYILEYQHNFKKTTFLGRLTYSDRSINTGELYELEVYPVVNDKLYFFGNVGFSSGALFPKFKMSASAFYNIAKGFELETGGKLLQLDGNNYFTGVVGLTNYVGKFYLNIRSNLGPDRLSQFIQNYQFNARYYYKGSDNFIFTRLSRGISPDESALFVQIQENPGLEAYYAGTGINFLLGTRHIIRADTGLLFEEINSDTKGRQVLLGLGYRFRF